MTQGTAGVGVRCLTALCSTIIGSHAFAVDFRPAMGGWVWPEAYSALWQGGCKRSTAQPQQSLTKEPRYKTTPWYIQISAGNSGDDIFCGALDGSPTGTCNMLYLDANKNGDLTDDPALELKPPPTNSYAIWKTDPVGLPVKYRGGTERQFHIEILAILTGDTKSPCWYGYQVADHMKGRVDAGYRKGLLVEIYDTNRDGCGANGCFNDNGVDRLRIDLNGDEVCDNKTEDFMLGRFVRIGGSYWEISANASASEVTLSPCKLANAQILFKAPWIVGNATNTTIWLRGMGSQFKCDLRTGTTLETVPEGGYALSADNCVAIDNEGNRWTFELFTRGRLLFKQSCTPREVCFGSPLTLVPQVPNVIRSGESISVTASLTGVSGEEFKSFTRNGQRLAPSVRIADALGNVVSHGNMEFG
ncbi:MAG: hypothetical protein WCP86_09280 [bacterium]